MVYGLVAILYSIISSFAKLALDAENIMKIRKDILAPYSKYAELQCKTEVCIAIMKSDIKLLLLDHFESPSYSY